VSAGWKDEPMFDVPAVDVDEAAPVELDPVDEARAAVTLGGGDGAGLLRADALRLPLADESVDLVITSPPYFALRSYQDSGGHYDGQIGSEPTPQAFLEALWAVTGECLRVLKPGGSIFLNLGDKMSGAGGPGGDYNKGGLKDGQPRYGAADYWQKMSPKNNGIPAKSLMLLPEAYRLGCNGLLHTLGGPPPPSYVDAAGRLHQGPWIARAVIVWSKPNGLPESVTDRVRRSHEDWVHLVKQPRYYAAVDNIREAYAASSVARSGYVMQDGPAWTAKLARGDKVTPSTPTPYADNPLGKLPGSVWEVATEPLRVPDWVGVDHFAAFPTEWPRRLILGWSPSGVCTVCGEGRRPVTERGSMERHNNGKHGPTGLAPDNNHGKGASTLDIIPDWRITGEACACPTPDAPTRPAVVLDPFGGTGTTAMVARSLGRFGVSVDLSADYLRLARWRIWQSGHGQKAVSRTWRERQESLFDGEVA
jgi:DNA modification methylase